MDKESYISGLQLRKAKSDEAKIIVIYKYPKDYPDKFVGRLWINEKPTDVFITGDSLDEIRYLIPENYVRIPRYENDDTVIVETWIL